MSAVVKPTTVEPSAAKPSVVKPSVVKPSVVVNTCRALFLAAAVVACVLKVPTPTLVILGGFVAVSLIPTRSAGWLRGWRYGVVGYGMAVLATGPLAPLFITDEKLGTHYAVVIPASGIALLGTWGWQRSKPSRPPQATVHQRWPMHTLQAVYAVTAVLSAVISGATWPLYLVLGFLVASLVPAPRVVSIASWCTGMQIYSSFALIALASLLNVMPDRAGFGILLVLFLIAITGIGIPVWQVVVTLNEAHAARMAAAPPVGASRLISPGPIPPGSIPPGPIAPPGAVAPRPGVPVPPLPGQQPPHQVPYGPYHAWTPSPPR
ncbi:hypothetical protein [Gordonia crocea]|uniref:hypothetical protein n=1 Tax=Gordonia crocea TaxID=589162 RepID=UPI00137A5009|nr:hypothetical protein [Gordonia crocea]